VVQKPDPLKSKPAPAPIKRSTFFQQCEHRVRGDAVMRWNASDRCAQERHWYSQVRSPRLGHPEMLRFDLLAADRHGEVDRLLLVR
jgi:hypothetical protein